MAPLERLPADADAVVACQAADSSAEQSYRRAYLEALEPLVGEADAAAAASAIIAQTTGGSLTSRLQKPLGERG